MRRCQDASSSKALLANAGDGASSMSVNRIPFDVDSH